MRLFRLALPVMALLAASPVAAQDREGTDHPLLPRYEGATIIQYRDGSLDEILIPTAAVSDENQAKGEALEGRVTHLDYRVTPAASPLTMARHSAAVLAANGFETVFSCSGQNDCGRSMDALISNSGKVAPVGFSDAVFSERLRVVVARRQADWILVRVDEAPDRSLIYTAIIEDSHPAR